MPGLDARIDQSARLLPQRALTEKDREQLRQVIKAAAASPNELEFRRALMDHLVTERYVPAARREMLAEGLAFYRARHSASSPTPIFVNAASRLPRAIDTSKAARGGQYHRRVPIMKRGKIVGYKYYDEASYNKLDHAHVDGAKARQDYLRGACTKIIDRAGGAAEVEHFHPLVRQHSAAEVAAALRAIGAVHHKGRVTRQSLVVKAAEALPAADVPSPKKLPPGSRRVWHNRVMERGVDDKWHVVGHVAGLENTGKVPPLAAHEIDPEHKKELIAKLKELIQHEKQKHKAINMPMPAAKEELTVPQKAKAKSPPTDAPQDKSAKPSSTPKKNSEAT